MRFKQGTHVYTSDQQDVGTVDRVVLDPATDEVTGLVVRKGWLFTEDKVVPVGMVETATEERVTLRRTEASLDKLPEFEETYYVPAEEYDYAADVTPAAPYAAPLYTYPPAGTAWWGYGSYIGVPPLGLEPDVATRTEKNIPEGTVAVREGARVISQEGDHVGDIEEVIIDETSDRATHIVIARGLLFKERKLIPANWIKVAGEDEVILTVRTSVVEGLAEYQT